MSKLVQTFARRSVLLVVTLLSVSTVAPGFLTAQAREPDIRIVGADHYLEGFSKNGRYLLVSGVHTVKRYDLARRRFDYQLAFSGGSFGISSDGTRLARAAGPEVQVIDFDSGEVQFSLRLPIEAPPRSSAIVFEDDYLHVTYWYDVAGEIYLRAENYTVNTASATWRKCELSFEGMDCESASEFHGTMASARDAMPNELLSISVSGDGTKLLVIERVPSDTNEPADVLHILDRRELTPLGEEWANPSGRYRLDQLDVVRPLWVGERPIVVYSIRQPSVGLTVLDVQERSVLLSLPFSPADFVLSADGHWMAVKKSQSSAIWVYALEGTVSPGGFVDTSSQPRLVAQLGNSAKQTSGLAISHDGHIVAIAGGDGWVSVWERATGSEFRRLPSSGGELALSLDGSVVLSAAAPFSGAVGASWIGAEWSVQTGQLRRHLDFLEYGEGDIFASFLADGDKTMLCSSVGECVIKGISEEENEFWERVERDGRRGLELFGARDTYGAMSIAPDERAVAVAVGDVGVGWMELDHRGRRAIVPAIDDVEVSAVAALNHGRVIAGFVNGDVRLIDAVSGLTLNSLRTRDTEIASIVRLSDSRIAVASQGSWERGGDRQDWEVLIVSLPGLTLLDRLKYDDEKADSYTTSAGTRTYIDRLAASGNGRWLVATLHNAEGLRSVAQVWDTSTLETTVMLGSQVQAALRVEFDKAADLLLVAGARAAFLWDLKAGYIAHRSFHSVSVRGERRAALTGDTLLTAGLIEKEGIQSWSRRLGSRALVVREREDASWLSTILAMAADGASVGYTAFDGLGLLSLDDQAESARFVERRLARGDEVEAVTGDVQLHESADLVLLNRGTEGVEALRISDGTSVWRRRDILAYDDLFRYTIMLTEDESSVVVEFQAPPDVPSDGDEEDGLLLVLDAADGRTRFILRHSFSERVVPVVNNGRAQEILRLTNDRRIERWDLRYGSVINSTNLGIGRLDFAVSDRTGSVYLVGDGGGDVVLWDTTTGERTVFKSTTTGTENVSFSPDGKVLAIGETDGSVKLYDVSKPGLFALQPESWLN